MMRVSKKKSRNRTAAAAKAMAMEICKCLNICDSEKINSVSNILLAKGKKKMKMRRRRWREKHKYELVGPGIEKVEKYNVPRLLSSSSPPRDYLTRNNQQQVKIDKLRGKHVLLLFWGIHEHTPYFTTTLFMIELDELYRTRSAEFEVVFVALHNNKASFDEAFSSMPWLAVPFEDSQFRLSLPQKFSYQGDGRYHALFFDPKGILVLGELTIPVFEGVGFRGFPFTKQRMDELHCKQPHAFWNEILVHRKVPSLTSLLGDHVVSSEGNKVPTSELQKADNIVGLYFFGEGSDAVLRTHTLLKTWNSLKKDGKHEEFKIVFINRDRSARRFLERKDFQKLFGCTNPWYTLPFDGTELSMLFRLSLEGFPNQNGAGYLIVLKSDKYYPLSYFAFHIMESFGHRAYPFTLEAAVKISRKVERAFSWTSFATAKSLIRAAGQGTYDRIKVSALRRTRILLLFATNSCYKSGLFMPELMRIYNEKKGTKESFEIIYMSLDCEKSESYFLRSIRKMPWVAHPFDPELSADMVAFFFGLKLPHDRLPAIVAFKQNGDIVTKESNLATKEEWSTSFPFIRTDMDEFRRVLVDRYKWDLEKFHQSKPHSLYD